MKSGICVHQLPTRNDNRLVLLVLLQVVERRLGDGKDVGRQLTDACLAVLLHVCLFFFGTIRFKMRSAASC